MAHPDDLSRREAIADLYSQGVKVREIADRLEISTQRVYQQLKKLDLPPPTAVTNQETYAHDDS